MLAYPASRGLRALEGAGLGVSGLPAASPASPRIPGALVVPIRIRTRAASVGPTPRDPDLADSG